jgi:pyridoxal phosphate enzyme (YggS family)
VFGENRVQEAKGKWPALKLRWPDIELHLIGPLQSNKAAEAVELFDAIHTVDRPKIAEALAREMRKQAKALKLFVQVNTGREPQKAGIDPDAADAFLAACRDVHGLAISGLMCIPPAEEDPKPHFDMLGAIARRNGIPLLSMGMSGDYAAAVACGATHVRVGSAIFGTRG